MSLQEAVIAFLASVGLLTVMGLIALVVYAVVTYEKKDNY